MTQPARQVRPNSLEAARVRALEPAFLAACKFWRRIRWSGMFAAAASLPALN